MAPNVATLNSNVVKLNFGWILSPSRLRSFINRLPFFTRIVMFLIVTAWIASFFLPWLPEAGALVPSKVSLLAAHRLNTYPIVHSTSVHAIVNLIGLIPLMERFESDHGTLVCIALFAGPFATIPGGLYILFDHVIFRDDSAILGASIWIILLLSIESIKLYKTNPSFKLGTLAIPTWPYPLALTLVLFFLLPGYTSLTGHLAGAAVGYLFGLGYLKILVPPEKTLKWIESKLNLLGRLPHYVSVDQKTYGRYGVLPTARQTEEGGLSAAQAGTMWSSSGRGLGPPP